jgi:hypothetical protein
MLYASIFDGDDEKLAKMSDGGGRLLRAKSNLVLRSPLRKCVKE